MEIRRVRWGRPEKMTASLFLKRRRAILSSVIVLILRSELRLATRPYPRLPRCPLTGSPTPDRWRVAPADHSAASNTCDEWRPRKRSCPRRRVGLSSLPTRRTTPAAHRTLSIKCTPRGVQRSSGGAATTAIRLSAYVCFEFDATGGRLGYGVERRHDFCNEVETSPDLSMPESASDPVDRVGKADAYLAIFC
jgi:hypothetical protein